MSDEDLLSNEPLDETTELAALAKAIALGSGYGFKLLFACISHDGHRQRLEQSLISQVAPLKVLRVALAKDVSFVLDDLQTWFEDQHPDALSVSGLEQSIFAHEKPHSAPVLAGLNIGRSSFFTRLPCPLLFWMTPDALTLLSRGAPDFFSIRSGVYRFEESVPELSSILFELSLLRNKLNPPLQQLETLLGEVIRHQGQQHSLAGQAFLLLGDCFLRAHRPDLAERAYHLAQVPFLATESTSGLVHARIGLSLARYRMGNLASARATVETALELARNEGLREEETRALLVLGDVYAGLGEPFKAGDAFERASKLADRLGNKDWVAQAREGLERSGKLVGTGSWGITRNSIITASAVLAQSLWLPTGDHATPDQNKIPAPPPNGVIDFLLIAPLKEEREAILAHLGNARRIAPNGQDVRIYYHADLATQFAGGSTGSYRVIVTSPLGMGRVEAATATADAIRRWQPRYVLLVGIAGGDPAEVGLGDVLIAEQFVDYELAKRTDEDAKPQQEQPPANPREYALHNSVRRFNERTRYQTFRADPRLYNAAQHLSGWEASVRVARPDAGTPSTYTGIVISGDKVQAATDALAPYKADWPKLIGVEMEAAGVAAAAWEAVSKPGVLMVRGVSDLADAKKGSSRVKKWRPYACDVAAAFAISLLRDGPVPLRAPLQAAAPAIPDPQNQAPAQPTRASLRKVLHLVLRTDSDLDAFCLDYFPQVKRLFSAGMDTENKRSLLLEKEDSTRIWMNLQEAEPLACAKYANLIVMER